MSSNETQANINIISSWYITKFSRDMCMPALPAIALGLATSTSYVQYSVTLYFFGLSISRFLWTPLSDVYGRKHIILLSLPVFILGSLLAGFADDIYLFMLGRFLQALGIGCATSLERAMVYDVYGETRTIKALAVLSLVGVWAPAFATIIGGHLLHWFGWRSDFFFLTITGILLFIQTWKYMRETAIELLPKNQVIKQILQTYHLLIKDRAFCRYMFCFSFNFAGTVVYYTIAPFLFIKHMNVPAHIFGYFAIMTVMGLLVGKLIAARLIDLVSNDTVTLIGILISLAGGIAMLSTDMMHLREEVLITMLCVQIFFTGSGVLSSTSKVSSMSALPGTVGTAAALFGMVQGLVSTFGSAFAANVHAQTPIPMACILIFLSLLALGSFYWLRPKEVGQD